jgi:signal transduction histidine kinase
LFVEVTNFPNGRVLVNAQAASGEIEVRIADDGIGIPAKALPHIFEPFNQGERKVERSEKGLGLGLAIAKQYVGMWKCTEAV